MPTSVLIRDKISFVGVSHLARGSKSCSWALYRFRDIMSTIHKCTRWYIWMYIRTTYKYILSPSWHHVYDMHAYIYICVYIYIFMNIHFTHSLVRDTICTWHHVFSSFWRMRKFEVLLWKRRAFGCSERVGRCKGVSSDPPSLCKDFSSALSSLWKETTI